MNFPIYDISEFSWSNYRIKEHNVLFENPYSGIMPCSSDEFADRIRKFKFVDSDGNLYNVTGFKILPNQGLAKLFLLTKRIELDFVRIDEQYTLEMFKGLLIQRAKDTNNEKLEERVKHANSFKDILCQIV